jgi:hypothetical protein
VRKHGFFKRAATREIDNIEWTLIGECAYFLFGFPDEVPQLALLSLQPSLELQKHLLVKRGM